MIAVTRYRVPTHEADSFAGRAQTALEVLGARPGFLGGEAGPNLDDPALWVLTTRWADVGSYRRALSSTEAKLAAVPLLSEALDEPSAYEVRVQLP